MGLALLLLALSLLCSGSEPAGNQSQTDLLRLWRARGCRGLEYGHGHASGEAGPDPEAAEAAKMPHILSSSGESAQYVPRAVDVRPAGCSDRLQISLFSLLGCARVQLGHTLPGALRVPGASAGFSGACMRRRGGCSTTTCRVWVEHTMRRGQQAAGRGVQSPLPGP